MMRGEDRPLQFLRLGTSLRHSSAAARPETESLTDNQTAASFAVGSNTRIAEATRVPPEVDQIPPNPRPKSKAPPKTPWNPSKHMCVLAVPWMNPILPTNGNGLACDLQADARAVMPKTRYR